MNIMNLIRVAQDPQLQKYYNIWVRSCKYNGTWCELFKTKSYRRMMKHQAFVTKRFHNYIKRTYNPYNNTWTLKKISTLGWCFIWSKGETHNE